MLIIWEVHKDIILSVSDEIKQLREKTGMSKAKFAVHLGIPLRTIEDWEAGRRTPPEYIPRLISYQLKYEELVNHLGKEQVTDA